MYPGLIRIERLEGGRIHADGCDLFGLSLSYSLARRSLGSRGKYCRAKRKSIAVSGTLDDRGRLRFCKCSRDPIRIPVINLIWQK